MFQRLLILGKRWQLNEVKGKESSEDHLKGKKSRFRNQHGDAQRPVHWSLSLTLFPPRHLQWEKELSIQSVHSKLSKVNGLSTTHATKSKRVILGSVLREGAVFELDLRGQATLCQMRKNQNRHSTESHLLTAAMGHQQIGLSLPEALYTSMYSVMGNGFHNGVLSVLFSDLVGTQGSLDAW